MCYPKGLAGDYETCPKRKAACYPLWKLAVCDTAPSGTVPSVHDRPVSGERNHTYSARLGASQAIRVSFLPMFWASEGYQMWRQERQQNSFCNTTDRTLCIFVVSVVLEQWPPPH